MVPQVGQKIGPYEILGRLGTGGMGLVFSAWDSRLHRDVAIKLLREEFLTPTMRSRFLGEARAASRLNHPNICTIFDIGEHEGVPYLVMELLKGETLRGRMQRGRVPVEEIYCVAEEVADALSVAHGQGIVHRDIKPANIVLVSKPGGRFQTKVLDFGLAKLEVDEGSSHHEGLTTTGMTVGTVSYMSPEQARGELLDGRSDLFSLGVVLYEMATGELPFTGATSALVFVQLLNHPPEPLRDLNSGIPKALDQIITTCLQKDRNARYETAHDMVQALRGADSSAPPPQKQSWLDRLAAGFKKSDASGTTRSDSSVRQREDRSPLPLEENPSRPAGSGESLLRPVKPILPTGSDRGVVRGEGFPQPLPPGTVPPMLPGAPTFPSWGNGFKDPQPAPREGSTSTKPDASDAEAPLQKPAQPLPGDLQSRNPLSSAQRLEWAGYREPPSQSGEAQKESDAEVAAAGVLRKWRILLGVTVVLLLAVATVFVLVSKRAATPKAAVSVMLASVANRTGDDSLNGAVFAGLKLALEQSPHVALRNVDEYRGNSAENATTADSDLSMEEATRAAKAAGATALVFGEVHMEGSSYIVSLRVLNVETGKRITSCTSMAASKVRLPAAIDSVAANLRSNLGESEASLSRNAVPLSREGSANLEALQAYASGEQLAASGHPMPAMLAFERAISLDPQFARAYLHLAGLFYRQHAEIGAANAATQARAAAASASDRTRNLVEAAYSTIAQGDYTGAIATLEQLRQRYPLDTEVLDGLALAQRLQGDHHGALETAREAMRLSPADRLSADSAELALLALDDSATAVSMASSHVSLDTARPSVDILVSFLSGSGDAALAIAAAHPADDFEAQAYAASVFDAGGQFQEGAAKWRDIAARATAVPELSSAASYALAQAALDRALASDCPGALGLLHDAAGMPAGREAFFALGTASVLCGDLENGRRTMAALTTGYPQSFAVKAFYISDLNALIQLKSGAPADALVSLSSARQYDPISLTPYLRGLVNIAQGQPQLAIVELQAVLRHRGAATLVSPDAYPAAQVAAARAYAANGDGANSGQAYGNLVTQWSHADADTPLLTEARGFVR